MLGLSRKSRPRVMDGWYLARNAIGNAARRARRFGAESERFTKEQIARIHLLPCLYCGVMPALGTDHLVPFIRGGSNTLSNIAPACRSCNYRKHSKTAGEYLAVINAA